MLESQQLTGGFLPTKEVALDEGQQRQEMEEALVDAEEQQDEKKALAKSKDRRDAKHQSLLRPLTIGNWMFEAVADLVAPPTPAALRPLNEPRPVTRFSNLSQQTQVDPSAPSEKRRKHASAIVGTPTSPSQRRLSLQFTPTSTTFTLPPTYSIRMEDAVDADDSFENDKDVIQKSAGFARSGRSRRERRPTVTIAVDEKRPRSSKSKSSRRPETILEESGEKDEEVEEKRHAFWPLMRSVWPTVPNRPVLLLGLVVSVLSGAMTPVFSYLLSRLLFEVSIGAQNVAIINKFGGIVLGIAAADGLLIGLKYFLMEFCGIAWVTKLRTVALAKVLKQDSKFFDKRPENSPSKLVQILVKDAEDARNLIAVVWCQFLVVATMLSVGLIWAMIRGWQLTLVGLAVAPVFAGVMTLQTALVAKCELRNKRAREDVAKGYYDAIINVRGIRAMAFERLFWDQFDTATNRALTTGVRGAFVEGCTYGVASGLIYLAEALLFYVGAVLIAKGTYTYLQMVEVLNLVVFTVTIGSQLMAFSKFSALLALPTEMLTGYFLLQLKGLRSLPRPQAISTASSTSTRSLPTKHRVSSAPRFQVPSPSTMSTSPTPSDPTLLFSVGSTFRSRMASSSPSSAPQGRANRPWLHSFSDCTSLRPVTSLLEKPSSAISTSGTCATISRSSASIRTSSTPRSTKTSATAKLNFPMRPCGRLRSLRWPTNSL